MPMLHWSSAQVFQSTPSVGRATAWLLGRNHQISDFNPRPPWGGRPSTLYITVGVSKISIHALRGEGDRLHL